MDFRIKDPQDVRDYAVDVIVPDGDALTAASWTVASGDVVIDTSSIDGNAAIVRLSGGTLGTEAVVTCHAVTADGREGDQSIKLLLQNR